MDTSLNKSNREGTHEQYTTTDRHFCPKSEAYTGADSLLTAQRRGWKMVGRLVYREDILLRGSRFRTVYYFRLRRGYATLTMPILSNPYVLYIIRQERLEVLPYSRLQSAYLDDTIIIPAHLQSHA